MLNTINISLESLNLMSLLPIGVLVIGALVIICIDLLKKDLGRSFYTIFAMLFLLIDIAIVFGYSADERGVFDVILMDSFAIISQLIILISSILFLPLSLSKKLYDEYKMAEFFALFLFVVAGFMLMCATDNLILIFLGLEMASLALYTLIAMHTRKRTYEAALKYFTMGALAAGFYAFGAMIFYALSASVEINSILEVLARRENTPLYAILIASIFILGSLAFKLSIIPFHAWTPDVYEGSSEVMAGFMSIVPKIAAFVVAIRIFEFLSALGLFWIDVLLYILVVVTMSLGNLMALVQTDIKRMLAFSSISHAGFVLAAVLIGTSEANQALFLYWALFLVTNFGAFGMLWIARDDENSFDLRFDHPFEKYSGLIKNSPFFAIGFALFMFALAGIPPFSVFWGKLILMSAAINAGFIILAIIMAINSAVAVYYYLKVIVFMFLKEPKTEFKGFCNNSAILKGSAFLAFILTLTSVLFVSPLLEYIGFMLEI